MCSNKREIPLTFAAVQRILVIGGGAAGFFGAVNTARLTPDAEVTLLEKTTKLLSKVRISGGGRCNVTHACFDPAELSKHYPRGEKQLRQAFARFHAQHTVEWFADRGVQLKKESDGRMFPVTDDSATIVNTLLSEAQQFRVNIRLNAEVVSIKKENDQFQVTLRSGETLIADQLLVAAGGHAKSAAYDFLRNAGHTIVEPVPSLFTFNMPGEPVRDLMGVAVPDASVHVEGTKLKQQGPLLITHWGMSGPAVLKTSAWGARELAQRNYLFLALVNWLKTDEETLREELQQARREAAAKQVFNYNFTGLPRRLWEFLVLKAEIKPDMRWGDVSNKQASRLTELLLRDAYRVNGKTTFKEEFVTCGGIALGEVDFRTMESRKIPGLYFAGEVLDIDGVTGGFNFQAAWTTAWIAANAMAVSGHRDPN